MKSSKHQDAASRRTRASRLRPVLPIAAVTLVVTAVAPADAAPAPPYGPAQLVSVSSSNGLADEASDTPQVSADGTAVAFRSEATNLVAGDTNDSGDIFVRDRTNGTTRRASVNSSGLQGNFTSYSPAVSANGKVVVFTSEASNLVTGDTNRAADVFTHSFFTGRTTRISVGPGGRQADGWSSSDHLAISADGRYVAFTSEADNLVPGDTNGHSDVFVRDRSTGVTTLVSVGPRHRAGNSDSFAAAIAASGKAVAFESTASNLVTGDTNGARDVFLRDLVNHVTRRMSVDPGGQQAAHGSISATAAVSRDGTRVTFSSTAANLVTNDTNGAGDVFMRDRETGTTQLISRGMAGAPGNADSHFDAVVSPDGRYVTFSSDASNLVAGDRSGQDVFVRDLRYGTTTMLTVGWDGEPGNGTEQVAGGVSAEGRVVVFSSSASNLVEKDTNMRGDVFLRVRAAG